MAKLIILPLLYLLLSTYTFWQGLICGALSVVIFLDVQKFGLTGLFLKPSKTDQQLIFHCIESGNLENLKTLSNKIPPHILVNMRQPGSYTPLIFAIDYDRRDIVLWLCDEKGADVN